MQASKASILVVDDRPEKLLAMEALLGDLPVDVVLADSGRSALRHLLQREFAVILLDVNMPQMDGFETAALIRERKSTEHVPIIFMTAYNDDVFRERGYSLGAVDYILQPVVPAVLLAKVSVFVDLFEKTQQIREQSELHRRRADDLQQLVQASMRISSAPSVHAVIQRLADAARELLEGSRSATLVRLEGRDRAEFCAFSPASANQMPDPKALAQRRQNLEKLLGSRKSMRCAASELRQNDDAAADPHPAQTLIAELTAVDGSRRGFVEVIASALTPDDESILLLLAQTASISIENAISLEARDANRSKDRFLAVLSHELRTPLNPALMALSDMRNDPRIPADVQEDLDMARRNIQLEARLIDDLLDLTRISKGRVELKFTRVDVHDVLDESLRICAPDITAKSLRVSTHFHAPRHHILADMTRLQQIFWNIIKNAVKFTPAGGSIHISTQMAADKLEVSVADSGIGIDPEYLPRIFDAFEQGPRSVSREFGGLGLGLAITRTLVESHAGTITVRSEGKDKGTTFELRFPLVKEEAAFPPAPVEQPLVRNAQRLLRILVVEDHADTAEVMQRLLSNLGHDVEVAHSISEALSVAKTHRPDLVISDIGLPDGSGHDLMPQLRRHGPVVGIALSGYGMEEDVNKSRAAGFRDHLNKPLNFENLVECINQISAELETQSQACMAS